MRFRLAVTSQVRTPLPTLRPLASAVALALTAACAADERVAAPAAESPRIGPSLALTATPVNNAPLLPKVTLSTSLLTSTSTGRTLSVKSGQSLQRAIDTARVGDVIVLQAGATFRGNFRLRKKTGTGWITIRTSTSDANLPVGRRVSPADAPKLARLTTDDNSMWTLITEIGAHHYRLIGLEITHPSTIDYHNGLVVFGDGTNNQSTLSSVATDLVLDRSYVHGRSGVHQKRCITLNSARTVIMNSYIAECHSNWSDVSAIGGWNGPGPYLIENNYLEASVATILFGGADPNIPGLVPSDIEIRRNHFYRPTSWKGVWDVKNHLEFKNAQRVLIEGNVIENNWSDAQTGFALVWKSVNQQGRCTWCVVRDITFRYNKVRRTAGGLVLTGNGSSQTAVNASRIKVEHNVFEQMDTLDFTGVHRVFQFAGSLSDVTLNHNTVATRPSYLLMLAGGKMTRFDFRNSVVNTGSYGIKGDGTSSGSTSLSVFAPSYTFARNIAVKSGSASYPTNNAYPTSVSGVGFVDVARGNYRLASGSSYKGKASDGTDPGADIDELERRIAGVVVR
jgi:hypothetical protein